MNNFEIIMVCSVVLFWFIFFITAVSGVITLFLYCNPITKNKWGTAIENHKHFNKSFWSFIMLLCIFIFSFFLMIAVTR